MATEKVVLRDSVGIAEQKDISPEQVEMLKACKSLHEDIRKALEEERDIVIDIDKYNDNALNYYESVTNLLDDSLNDYSGIVDLTSGILKDLKGIRGEIGDGIRLTSRVGDITRKTRDIINDVGGTSLKQLTSNLNKAARVQSDMSEQVKRLYETYNGIGTIDLSTGNKYTKDINGLKAAYRDLGSEIESLEKKSGKSNRDRQKLNDLREEAKLYEVHINLLEQGGAAADKSYQLAAEARDNYLRGSTKTILTAPFVGSIGRLLGKLGFEGEAENIAGGLSDIKLRAGDKGNKDYKGAKGFFKANLESLKLLKSINLLTVAAGLFAVAVVKVWQSFKEVNKEAADVKQIVGSWNIGAAATNNAFATSVDYLKAVKILASDIKINPVSLFTPDEIGRMAEAKNLLGLTDQQASKLTVQSKLNVQSSDEYRRNLTDGINKGNGLNQTAIGLGTATRAALDASNAITVSMGNNAEQIGKAAVAAQAMGLSLAEVENISKGLMNFESSISAEMTAQLLTGRQLNLSKAREYALNNDLEGVARELQNQGMSMAEYGRLNYIQQESFAKALGMSREQMSQMLIQRYLSGQLSKEELKAATQMKDEQIEALSVTDRWRIATQKLVQAFTPLLEAIIPIVELISNLVSRMAGVVGFITSWGKRASNVGVGAKDKWTTDHSQYMGSPQWQRGQREAIKEAKRSGNTEKAEELQAELDNINPAQQAGFNIGGLILLSSTFGTLATIAKKCFKGMITGAGRAARGFLNLGKAVSHPVTSVKKLGTSVVETFKGGFNRVTAPTPTAPVSADLTKISGKKRKKLLKGAAKLDKVGTGKNLPVLGKNVNTFSNFLGKISWKGVAAIGAIGGAIALAGFGLKQATPAIEAFANVITSVFGGVATVIKTAAESLVMLLSAITLEKVGVVALLGGSLLSLSTGMLAFTGSSLALGVVLPLLTGLATVFNTLGNSFIASGKAKTSSSTELENSNVEPATKKVEKAHTDSIQQQKSEEIANNTTVLETKVLEKILTSIDNRLASGVDLRMNVDRLGRILALNQVGIG